MLAKVLIKSFYSQIMAYFMDLGAAVVDLRLGLVLDLVEGHEHPLGDTHEPEV